MAASGGRACVRSLRGGVLWRSRYGRAGGCWGRDQHRPSQALRAKPVLVAGSPRVGLTGRTRSHLSLGFRTGATSHGVDREMGVA